MLTLLPIALAASLAVSPSGKAATASPRVADFHAVSIGSGINATVVRGATSVKIDADEAILPYIETTVDAAGVLTIGVNKKGTLFMKTGKIVATITTPTLDGVQGSGGSTVNAVMTAAKSCKIGGSGGSQVTLASVACEQLAIDVSGGSTLEAVGAAKKLDISASGGSTVTVRKVTASVVTASGSGGSEIRAFASAELTGDLSGGSQLFLAGKPPARKIDASGGAQVIDIP